MEQPKSGIDLKSILFQVQNIESLNPEQISQIEPMSDKDKYEIIISMNKVLECLIYVLMIP